MGNKIRLTINALIASIIAALGYGCNSKKAAVSRPIETNHERQEEPIRVMYGTPSYFREQAEAQREPQIPKKYGVPTPKQKIEKPDTIVDDQPQEVLEPQPAERGEEVVCIYGVPHVSLRIKGRVTDKKSGKPLENIEVSVTTREGTEYPVVTDANGNYEYENTFLQPTDSVHLTFTDKNNRYNEKQIGEGVEFTGGTSWVDMGSADINIDAQLVKGKKK